MSVSKSLFVANGTAAVAASSGVMVWITENAPALGIIFTGIMVLVSTTFYLLNYLEGKRHHREMEKHK